LEGIKEKCGLNMYGEKGRKGDFTMGNRRKINFKEAHKLL